ncbi:MAG: hypothetical protein V2G41_09825 [bacterium JZ-2024 1]
MKNAETAAIIRAELHKLYSAGARVSAARPRYFVLAKDRNRTVIWPSSRSGKPYLSADATSAEYGGVRVRTLPLPCKENGYSDRLVDCIMEIIQGRPRQILWTIRQIVAARKWAETHALTYKQVKA